MSGGNRLQFSGGVGGLSNATVSCKRFNFASRQRAEDQEQTKRLASFLLVLIGRPVLVNPGGHRRGIITTFDLQIGLRECVQVRLPQRINKLVLIEDCAGRVVNLNGVNSVLACYRCKVKEWVSHF